MSNTNTNKGKVTFPVIRSAQFTRFGHQWVVRVHASDVDKAIKAGGLTVTKRDGSKSRQYVTGLRELKSGATTWEHQGQTWSAIDVEAHEDEAAAYEAAKAERAAERKAKRAGKTAEVPAGMVAAEDVAAMVAQQVAAALASILGDAAPATGKSKGASTTDEVGEILADA